VAGHFFYIVSILTNIIRTAQMAHQSNIILTITFNYSASISGFNLLVAIY